MRQYLGGLAAQQQAPKTSSAMRTHHHKIGGYLLGCVQNALGSVAVGHMHLGQMGAGFPGDLFRICQNALCRFFLGLVEIFDDRTGVHHHDFGARRHDD